MLGAATNDTTRAMTDAAWRRELELEGAQGGFYRPLGADHSALFIAGTPTLVVTFENAATIRQREPDQMPFGLSVAEMRGWSHLCLISHAARWYRDPAVYGFFDEMVDESFFEQFDHVVFFGAGMGGYAAAAFSVAAPGATVIALHPQATLDPAVAGWDPRFADRRGLDFTSRYGYAPDMTEGTGQAFVIHDPDQPLDSMHAALFRRPWTTLVPARHGGADLYASLSSMHILHSILSSAATGSFDARLFATFYRARRSNLPYLNRMLARLESDGRFGLAAMAAESAGRRLREPRLLEAAQKLRLKALD